MTTPLGLCSTRREPRREDVIRSGAKTTATALACLAAAGCTLQTPDEPIVRPRVLSVEVTPSAVTMDAGESAKFQAIVTGDGAVPPAVTWALEWPGRGRIATDGTYTAPDVVDATFTEHVTATSVVAGNPLLPGTDPGAGTATVQILGPSVVVTPGSAEVGPGESVQFEAEVHGSASKHVFWWCSYGSIGTDGLYRAPDVAFRPTALVQATSTVTLARAEATVRLRLTPPVLSGTSGPAGVGQVLTIFGSGFYYGGYVYDVVFPGAGSELLARAAYSAPDRITVDVPQGAINGAVSIRVRYDGFDTVESNAVPFERAPALRVHPDRGLLSPAESTHVRVAFLGTPPSPLSFETDLGSMTGDVYTAPAAVAGRSHANVKICLTGTSACAGVTIGIVPFRIEPGPAVVGSGGTIALAASAGGAPVAAVFSLGSGGGTVTPGGLYTAPSSLADAGSTWLLADAGSGAAPVQVAVSGLAPGIVARIAGDVDPGASPLRSGVAWGERADGIAVAGGRAYVHAQPATGQAHRWIDVYDLGDPIRPVWVGAVESTVEQAESLALARGRLYVLGSVRLDWDIRSVVEVFDLSGPLPALVAQSTGPVVPGPDFIAAVTDGDFLYEFSQVLSGAMTVSIRSLVDGALPTARMVRVDVRTEDSRCPRWLATAAGGRVYLACHYYGGGYGNSLLDVWDVSGDAANLIGTAASQNARGPSSPQPRVVGQLVEAYGACWDRRTPLPVEVPCSRGASMASAGAAYVARASDGEVIGVDRTLLSDPRVRSTVHGTAGSPTRGTLDGGLYYNAEPDGAIAIYDLAPGGGPAPVGSTRATAVRILAGAVLQGGVLYAGGASTSQGGCLEAWDLAAASSSLAWSVALAVPVRAVAAGGGLLLAGSSEGLDVYSIDTPGNPAALAVVPLDTSAVALDGALAWVGTASGDLVALDLAAPTAPIELGRTSLGAAISAIALLPAGRLAVVTAGSTSGDLLLVDAATPAAPSVLGAAGLATPAFDVAIVGATALVTTAGDLIALDVAEAAAPTVLATIPLTEATPYASATGARPPHVQVNGGLVWTLPSGSNVVVRAYDFRNPRWPRLVVESGLGGFGLVLGGARAYAIGGGVFSELDVSAPRNVLLASGPAPIDPPGVTLPVTLP